MTRTLCSPKLVALWLLAVVPACAHETSSVAGDATSSRDPDAMAAGAPAPAPAPTEALSPTPGSPRAVVAAQLDAYNAGNLEAFMATFHSDAELFILGDSTPRAQGKDAVREVYAGLFEDSPDLHSELVHRAVIGNRVIDHERITGRQGSGTPLELVMVYEVVDGGIRRAWSIRP